MKTVLEVYSYTVGPIAENSYLLVCSGTRHAVFVDPGAEGERLWQAAQDANAELKAILLTHAHLDHVGAVELIRQRARIPVYLHPADDSLLADVVAIAKMFGIAMEPVAPAEFPLAHNERVSFGGVSLHTLHTPGHSLGSMCFYAADDNVLIAGDTLFRRGVGRTDLPGGDAHTLFESITTQLWPLPDQTKIYAGHGGETTIGEERELNPFVGTRASWGQREG